MRNKLLISLAPVLATAAFVVMPAVAQAAAPHYYAQGVEAKAGLTYASISWGDLTLANSNHTLAPLNCENAIIGDYSNPSGGGAGEGETDNFSTTDCADTECPEEEGVEFQIHSEFLPWASKLVESGSNILLETPSASFLMGCYVAHTSELVAEPTLCTGASDPLTEPGSPGQFSESKVNFTGQSDHLACTTEPGGVKTEGITEKAFRTGTYGTVPTKKVDIETSNSKGLEVLDSCVSDTGGVCTG